MNTTDLGLTVMMLILVLVMMMVAYTIEKAVKGRRKRKIEAVAKSSPTINELINLCKSLGIRYDLEPKYAKTFRVKSKQTFDYFNFHKHIVNDVLENYDDYKELHDAFETNVYAWIEFSEQAKEIKRIPPSPELLKKLGLSEQKYLEYESELIRKLKENEPPDHADIEYTALYVTPKGTKTYADTYVASSDSIGAFLSEADKINEYRESSKYQRALVNVSTRIRIIAKDHGRCCLCGRSANEGAQLEVDHFIPVSLGGKSTDDNLWTLCRDCNRGKSNYTIEELQEVFDQAIAERN